MRYCTNMEHVSVGKDYFKAGFKRSSVKGEKQEAAGRVISHPKRNHPQIKHSFNPEPLEPPEDQKHESIFHLLGRQGKDKKLCGRSPLSERPVMPLFGLSIQS